MDSRAKQRLTGAVILVALFVLLVPELLTGPRKAGGDAPNEDGMRQYTIDLDAPAGGTSSPPAAPQGEVSLPPIAENPMSAAEPSAAPGETARPEAAAPAPVASTPTPTPAPVVAPMATPPQTVATNPAPTVSPAKPAVTPTPTRTETARAPTTQEPAPRGGFAVQLGSFVSKENAERLVKEMTAKGFSAFLAPPIKTGGRELWRVRVGPTRDRASAEALAAQLRRIGQGGSIVSIS